MNKSTQKTLAFFLVAMTGMLLLNCKSNQEDDADSIARAKARELAFIKKQADYVSEHGHKKNYDLKTGRVQE